jgi:hypothetical protein
MPRRITIPAPIEIENADEVEVKGKKQKPSVSLPNFIRHWLSASKEWQTTLEAADAAIEVMSSFREYDAADKDMENPLLKEGSKVLISDEAYAILKSVVASFDINTSIKVYFFPLIRAIHKAEKLTKEELEKEAEAQKALTS